MWQVALALVAALALAIPAGLYGGWLGAVVFGAAAGVVAFLAIGRRVARAVDRTTAPVQAHLRAGRVDAALRQLERARPLSRWQLGLRGAIDGQLGMLIYAQKRDAARARPYLERASRRLWQAQAMLAAVHFRAGRDDAMRATFRRAIRRHRKVGILYGAYGYCERALGHSDRALGIVAEGVARVPGDARLRKNLLALQNRKRMSMRAYGPDWWALGLEAPPREATQQPPPGARWRRRR